MRTVDWILQNARVVTMDHSNRILEAGTRVAGPGFVEALNRELGFAPGPVDEALRRAVAWFTEHGYVTA